MRVKLQARSCPIDSIGLNRCRLSINIRFAHVEGGSTMSCINRWLSAHTWGCKASQHFLYFSQLSNHMEIKMSYSYRPPPASQFPRCTSDLKTIPGSSPSKPGVVFGFSLWCYGCISPLCRHPIRNRIPAKRAELIFIVSIPPTADNQAYSHKEMQVRWD
jgi:hypothetical protein